MIYKVPKEDQYDKLNYFFLTFSRPEALFPYQLIITMDFESLKFLSLQKLELIARKLEIDYSNLSLKDLMEQIKLNIEFE